MAGADDHCSEQLAHGGRSIFEFSRGAVRSGCTLWERRCQFKGRDGCARV